MLSRLTVLAAASLCGLSGTAFAASADPNQATALPAPLVSLSSETAFATSDDADASATEPAPVEPAEQESDWQVSSITYLWFSGVHGDVEIPGGENEVEVDQSFIDLLSDLEFGFMGALDVRHKRFVAIGDILFTRLGTKAEPRNNLDFLTAKVTTKMFIGTLVGGYRIVDQGPLFIDILAGGRLGAVDVKLELDGPLQTRERDADRSNVSPLVGARIHIPLGPRWGLGLYSDVALTKSAVVRWHAVGTVQYEISRRWRAALGWRHMDIHHDSQRADIDLNMTGPFLGFIYGF